MRAIPFVIKISDLSSKVGGKFASIKSINCSNTTPAFQKPARQSQRLSSAKSFKTDHHLGVCMYFEMMMFITIILGTYRYRAFALPTEIIV